VTTRTRIALRVLAAALLIFAWVSFMLAVISSFRSGHQVSTNSGGYQIDHIVEIDHWTVLVGLVGGVLLILSFIRRRRQAWFNEI
jgi:membrane associated rhomboid family serine protease